MRIMVDTNILLSALVFGSARMATLLERVGEEYTMVICTYIIDEFRKVVTEKSPKYNDAVDMLFSRLPYELVYSPQWQENMPNLRDEKDKPILAAAIAADVDIIITGDKDFLESDIERPEIISHLDFWDRYLK